ncbi:hypothetical protein ACHWQZ_G005690 [Mnemiopsis leidyi]
MLAIYKALVRPHLEYCVQLWNPVAAHGNWATVLELESVQSRFTRLIDEVGTLPYSRRLEILNLTTLAERRIRGDLIEAFKATSGLTDYGSGLFKLSRSGRNLVSSNRCCKSVTKVKNSKGSFLPERVIPFWNKLPQEEALCYKVSCEITLYPVKNVRDLGLKASSNLSWSKHIGEMVAKARSKLSWILSVFKTRDRVVMMNLYKSLVRSLLEYCCPLWDPVKTTEIRLLEGVQRTFTSRIGGLCDMNYWERLSHLKLMSQQRRRERNVILMMWKTYHNVVPNSCNIKFVETTRYGTKALGGRGWNHGISSETFALSSSPDPPSSYSHFVDNSCSAFRDKDHAETYLTILNSLTEDLNFTIDPYPSSTFTYTSLRLSTEKLH